MAQGRFYLVRDRMSVVERMVHSGGLRLAVRDLGGSGRPVVLVHGGPGPNLGFFRSFPDLLSARFRVVLYDQRGHGRSTADADDFSWAALASDLEAVCAELALDDPLIVGHSWGGQVATMHASTYSRAAAAVLVDGLVTDVPGLSLGTALLRGVVREFRAIPLLWRISRFVGTAEELESFLAVCVQRAKRTMPDFNPDQVRRDMVRDDFGRYRARRPRHWARVNRAVAANPELALEVYDTIRCPLLFVGAERGGHRQFSAEAIERVRSRHPALQVMWMDCGHDVFAERPHDLVRAIEELETQLETN